MKKILLVVIPLLLASVHASAFYVQFSYGSSLSTTSTNISFNYSGYTDSPSTYFAGRLIGRVYLENASSSYFVGEFHHQAASSCASSTNIVSAPSYATSSPLTQMPSITPGCYASQTVNMAVPLSCIPNGTYSIRLDIATPQSPPFELDGYAFPTCAVVITGTTYPQSVINSLPYAYLGCGLVLATKVIGSFTVTGGGTYNTIVTANHGTCSSLSNASFTITPGSGPYSIYNDPYSAPLLVTSSTTTSINVSPGTYHFYIIDDAGCRIEDQVTINPAAMPTVSATKSPAQPGGGYCKNTCITLNATPSTGTGYTYQWKRNGSNISTNQSFCNIAGPSPTTTTYSVTISNSFGCTASTTVSALTNTSCTGSVASCCEGGPRREMRPEDSTALTTSIQVYPNPAADVVNIQFAEPVTYGTVLEFTDITGKIVRRIEVPEGAICYTMDVNDFPVGIYLANVYDQDTKIITTEFVVE